MSRRISLKDIAQELNISISTVSRALRNVGEVSEETRRKVKELAESWKYKPDPLALGLLKNKTGYIGVILPEPVSHFFFNRIEWHEHRGTGARLSFTDKLFI